MAFAMAIKQLSIREIGQSLARSCVVVGLFLMPFSAYLMNKFFVAAVILSVVFVEKKSYWQLIKRYRSVLLSLALLMLFVVGVFYSQGSSYYVLRSFDKYSKLIYFSLFIPLFQRQQWRVIAMGAFVFSVVAAMLTVWFFSWKEPFVNAIDFSFLIACAFFICLRASVVLKNYWRWICMGVIAICCWYLLLVSVQRTGYLLLAGLMTIFVWQQWKGRGLLAGFVLLSSLFFGLYTFSPKFQNRIALAVQEIKIYPEHIDQKHESIGMRIAFAQHSWYAIKRHPIIGNGTGSFFDVYPTTGGPLLYGRGFSHPHNEYVLIAFQLGFVGLFTFLAWFFFQWIESRQLPVFEHYLAQGFIVAFFLQGLCNASLFVNPAGAAFIVLLALVFGSANSNFHTSHT